jgi:hypothetical protein
MRGEGPGKDGVIGVDLHRNPIEPSEAAYEQIDAGGALRDTRRRDSLIICSAPAITVPALIVIATTGGIARRRRFVRYLGRRRRHMPDDRQPCAQDSNSTQNSHRTRQGSFHLLPPLTTFDSEYLEVYLIFRKRLSMIRPR